MSVKQDVKDLLSYQPGLSSSEMAEVLGKDRNNVRAAAKELVRDGELTGRDEAGTFRFYPAGNGQYHGQQQITHVRPGEGQSEQIEDLVPVRQPGGQVIHQLDDGRDRRLRRVPNEWLGGLDGQAFDDAGEVPVDHAENWWDPPPTGVAAVTNPTPRKEPSRALTVVPARPPEPTGWDYLGAFAGALTRLPMLNSENTREAISERESLKEQNAMLLEALQKLNGQSTLKPSGPLIVEEVRHAETDDRDPIAAPDLDDFTYSELAGIDAVARQKVQSDPAEEVPKRDVGDLVDPTRIWGHHLPFKERLALARAEAAEVVAREKVASRRVNELFARRQQDRAGDDKMSEPSQNPPQNDQTWGEWFAERFGAGGRKGWT